MYLIDELDAVVELDGIPHPEAGAPCPKVFAEENQLVLSYWGHDEPPYPPTTEPLVVVRFRGPHFHMFGPPNDEALAGHQLADRGLHSCSIFRVDKSSLVRSMERMNSVHPYHNPAIFDAMTHYIFTFHDSTFECVAESLETTIEQVGLNEEYSRTLAFLRRGRAGEGSER